MTHSYDSRTHRLAGFALTFLLALPAPGFSPLGAAALDLSAQPQSPLELAEHFESLTEGGLFNPVHAYSPDCATSGAARAEDGLAPSIYPHRERP